MLFITSIYRSTKMNTVNKQMSSQEKAAYGIVGGINIKELIKASNQIAKLNQYQPKPI